MKKLLMEQRLDLIRKLSLAKGFLLHEFNNGLHCRIVGIRTVDYWPSTGKAWELGTGKSKHLEPKQVIALAANETAEKQREAQTTTEEECPF